MKLLSILVVVVAMTNPAHATFPGRNGRIAFIQDNEVLTINADGSDIRQLTHLGPDNAASPPTTAPNRCVPVDVIHRTVNVDAFSS